MASEENPRVNMVLGLIAAGAILTLAIVAPGVPGALVKLGRQFKKYNKKRLRQIVKRLSDQELISFREGREDTIVTLTEKGKLKALKFNIDNLKIAEPVRWDGKWRIVLFDIPESKKAGRETLRRKLKELGFYQFQKSAFIHPFECKDEVSFIRANFEIKDYVKYLVVSQLEEEDFFKNWFGLSNR